MQRPWKQAEREHVQRPWKQKDLGLQGTAGVSIQYSLCYHPKNRLSKEGNAAERREQGRTSRERCPDLGQGFYSEGDRQSLGVRIEEDQSVSCVRGLDGEFYGSDCAGHSAQGFNQILLRCWYKAMWEVGLTSTISWLKYR